MRSPGSLGLVLLACAGLAGCARGPAEAELARDVQSQLDTLFGGKVLEVRTLKRQGSAPMVALEDGTKQAIVYYNATFEFTAPYDPSDWTGLNPELIATALGATDEGVIGLGRGRIEPGAEVRAYGSLVYQRTGDGWRPSLLPPPHEAAQGVAGREGGPRSSELIERLAQVANTTPGLRRGDDAIVAEELDRALQNITLRLDEGRKALVIATGPADGEYARFVESLRPRAADWAVQSVNTEGSVANALMIESGEARFGLVQSDVAAAAVTGEGAFSASGPLRHLRAVAALFPEPVHVVVRADSGIETIPQLRGRRVAVGQPGSGTRSTARQVLHAHGLEADDYVPIDVRDPAEALELLVAGRIDAVIEVVSAPWRQLSLAASQAPLALLSMEAAAMKQLDASVPGLTPLPIPARTYPWQITNVATAAATALIVANDEVPEASVVKVLDFLYARNLAQERGVSAARLSKANSQLGVTIPLHEGAARYFKVPAPATAAADPAPK